MPRCSQPAVLSRGGRPRRESEPTTQAPTVEGPPELPVAPVDERPLAYRYPAGGSLAFRILRMDSLGRVVRRSTSRATRSGSPQVRVSFLRSSPGHVARALDRTSPAGLVDNEVSRIPSDMVSSSAVELAAPGTAAASEEMTGVSSDA